MWKVVGAKVRLVSSAEVSARVSGRSELRSVRARFERKNSGAEVKKTTLETFVCLLLRSFRPFSSFYSWVHNDLACLLLPRCPKNLCLAAFASLWYYFKARSITTWLFASILIVLHLASEWRIASFILQLFVCLAVGAAHNFALSGGVISLQPLLGTSYHKPIVLHLASEWRRASFILQLFVCLAVCAAHNFARSGGGRDFFVAFAWY